MFLKSLYEIFMIKFCDEILIKKAPFLQAGRGLLHFWGFFKIFYHFLGIFLLANFLKSPQRITQRHAVRSSTDLCLSPRFVKDKKTQNKEKNIRNKKATLRQSTRAPFFESPKNQDFWGSPGEGWFYENRKNSKNRFMLESFNGKSSAKGGICKNV